jgi:Uncharacterized protein conserved in bacteria (DUF2130)
MPNKCPLCGQVLPAAMDEQQLHEKLDKMKFAAIQAATKTARKELEDEFSGRLKAEREIARKEAERGFSADLQGLRKKLETAERSTAKQVEDARKAATVETGRLMKGQLEDLNKKLREGEKKRDAEVAKAKKQAAEEAREKEQLKHTVEMSRLQSKVEDLNRQLEKKSGEQFGEEGELDLHAELVRAFPSDKIERIGRGVTGADIHHKVMDGARVAGCIVYESKNVSTWLNTFITQARKYHTQYETPYVMVVSRVFPKKQRGMCVVDNVPVVEPRLATTLAGVMREGILEIAKLRLTRVDTDEKAQELFAYVVGNEFQTRFRDMANAVEGLQNIQRAERTWHENHWSKQSRLHAQIESRHREVNAKLQLIAKADVGRKPMAVAVGGR